MPVVLAAAAILGLENRSAHAEEDCAGTMEQAAAADPVDSRSIALTDGRVVRIAGMEPFSLLLADAEGVEEALRQKLSTLLSGRPLKVRSVSASPDRYGRIPALIAVDGVLVQEVLAREGLAVAFADGEPLPCFSRLLAAEEEARRTGRGFWAAEPIRPARPAALDDRIGKFAIFEGRIVSVGNRRARTYLNFGDVWSRDVTAEVVARDRDRFGGEDALAALSGSTVRVRGYLEEKGGPMAAIRSPMQIEVIDGPAKNAP